MPFTRLSYFALILSYPTAVLSILFSKNIEQNLIYIISANIHILFVVIFSVILIFAKNKIIKNHSKNIILVNIQMIICFLLSFYFAIFIAIAINLRFELINIIFISINAFLYFKFFLPKLREGVQAADAGSSVSNAGWVFARRPMLSSSDAHGRTESSGPGSPPPSKSQPIGTVTKLGKFSLRVARIAPEEKGAGDELVLEVCGIPEIKKRATVVIVTSLLDVTDDPSHEIGLPVEARTEQLQEPYLPYYRFQLPPMEMDRGGGFLDWQPIAPLPQGLIKPPKSGKRVLRAIVRFVDIDNPSEIMAGILNPRGPSPLCDYKHEFELDFEDPGYIEDIQNRELQRPLYIRLAVGVAMSDGSLDDEEGAVISNWIRAHLAAIEDEEKKAATKNTCNDALRKAFADAEAGKLSIEEICAEIRKVSSVPDRFDALELCLKVLAADGVADPEEMNFLRRTAKYLELDLDEFRTAVERELQGVTVVRSDDLTAMEAEAGIDPDASIEDKRKEVRNAFREWNARVASAISQEDKDRANKRLETLGKLKNLYSNS